MVAYSILLLTALALHCKITWAIHKRVIFAIDKKHGLNPSSHQVVSNRLFEFQFLKEKEHLSHHADMFTHGEWPVATSILSRSNHSILPHIAVSNDLFELFENKAKWKIWMNEMGMGQHIPKSVNVSEGTDHLTFPLVLKSSRKQFGEGVQIVHTVADLSRALQKIPVEEQDTVVIEEALLGMGLQEMTSFGSAYQGRLLSLRCSLRRIDPSKTSPRTGTDSSAQSDAPAPFVRSNAVKWAEDRGVACGRDVVQAVSAVLARTNYTGALCVDWKMDGQQRLKMLEINARVCGTQRKVYGDGYVVSAFVPLSFAVLRANTADAHYQERSALLHSNLTGTFHTILAMEECALRTGGGVFPELGWQAVSRFNLTLFTTPLVDTYLALFDENGHAASTPEFHCLDDSAPAPSKARSRLRP